MERATGRATAQRRPLCRLAVGLCASLYCAFAACVALWMTFTEVLVGYELRDGGRTAACRYFTGLHVVERRRPRGAGGTGPGACPLVWRD